MNVKTFIDRPIFAGVISVMILLVGLIGLVQLPVEQFPEIAPPTVSVSANYAGANAETVQKSVLVPLEEAINGVEDMMYMVSSATNNGSANIQIYFRQGTDGDMAMVNVQNRIASAQSLLPGEVTKSGVTVKVGDSTDDDCVASVTGSYSGGGGTGTLIKTVSLGTLSTSSTSATDTGKTIEMASSTGWSNYDLLLVDISVDSVTNGRHTSSVGFVFLTGTSNVNTKNTYAVGSNVWNSKVNSSGTKSTRQSSSKYGIYANSATVADGTLTLPVYYRYNSNNTGTINNAYTARVYGIDLIDLVGG